jgi:hypothetical protein
MMVNRETVGSWLDELRAAWESKDVDRALALFKHTDAYYERPFEAGTTQDDILGYWKGIVGLYDIRFEYAIEAIEGDVACVRWDNWFRESPDAKVQHLNGMFVIEFDSADQCRVFRQWWFLEP